ncbi:MAG: hypothetical protein AAF518_15675 [Spirochaetota bacterium]
MNQRKKFFRKRIFHFLFGGFFFLFFLTIFYGIPVMLLWNWLIPSLFGLGKISYLQSCGLVLLSNLLFKTGGDGHFSRHSHQRRRYCQKSNEPVETT